MALGPYQLSSVYFHVLNSITFRCHVSFMQSPSVREISCLNPLSTWKFLYSLRVAQTLERNLSRKNENFEGMTEGAVRPWWRVISNQRNRNFIIITPAYTVNKRWFWPCGRGWGSLQRERWLQRLSGKLPRILAWKMIALRKMVTALAEQIRMDLQHLYLIKCRQSFWVAQRWVVHCILGTLPRQWQLPWGSYFFMPLFMNRLCLTSPERFLKTWYWL